MNFVRKLEAIVKPITLVALFVVLLLVGFCREAKADVSVEVGASFLSGEYSKGQALLLTEQFDKYSIGVGYITEQTVTDRSGNTYYPMENVFVHGMRHVDITDSFNLGIGVAYFNNTNRALGSHFEFSLLVRYEFTDHWSIQLRHFSNAGSARPNMGQDLITVGYSFGR